MTDDDTVKLRTDRPQDGVRQSASSGTTLTSFSDIQRGTVLSNISRYEIGVATDINSIHSRLTDGTIGNLSNSGAFSTPSDGEFAFQANLTIPAGTNNNTAVRSVHQGFFANLVMPNPALDPDPTDNEFVFEDDAPAGKGQDPEFYDPIVSVGYDYAITPGSGNQFAELYLPGGFTDGIYTLVITDGDHPLFGQEIEVFGDQVGASYDFTYLDNLSNEVGIESFRILGIEPEAYVNPADQLGFPTGLTFFNPLVTAQFTQTAITANIPEPASMATLLAAGLLGLTRRR